MFLHGNKIKEKVSNIIILYAIINIGLTRHAIKKRLCDRSNCECVAILSEIYESCPLSI